MYIIIFYIALCITEAHAADNCSLVIPGASKNGYNGTYGGFESNGNCHYRDISEETCRQFTEHLFIGYFPDYGAGYSRCEFDEPGPRDDGTGNQNERNQLNSKEYEKNNSFGNEDDAYNTDSSAKRNSKKREKYSQYASIAVGGVRGVAGKVRSEVWGYIEYDMESKEEAEEEVLSICYAEKPNCKILVTWNTGCYWVTSGKKGGTVGYYGANTKKKAMAKCRQANMQCDGEFIGKCYPE
ncbi:MAG: DUF4189 domain-containing protein [Rhizobiaceae bacterium]